MSIWIELLWRELVVLGLLGALGAGAVVLLHPATDRASRWGLAPAYGLAIATCVFTTTIWRAPASKSGWLWPILVIASLAVAVWRTPTARSPRAIARAIALPRREVAQLAAVVIIVLGAYNAPMAARDTTGPVGGYRVADSVDYVDQTDGMRAESLHAARSQHPPFTDATIERWASQAVGYQQLGPDTVAANLGTLLNMRSTALFAPYVIVLILIGALGAYAAVRQVTATRSWWAIVAGLLFAGPMFHTLFMDGSVAATFGLVLLAPTLLAGWRALEGGRWMDCVLFAVLVAGVQTGYPLFLPHLALLGGVVLAVLAVQRARRRELTRDLVAAAAVRIGAIVVLTAALTPVAFERNVRYWKAILSGFSYAGLPAYDLPAGVLPGWLSQTREFYDLPHLSTLGAGGIFSSILLPLALVAVIVIGLRKYPVAMTTVLLVAVAGVLAYHASNTDHCSYCVQRNLLLVAPVVMVLVGVGLVALANGSRATRAAGIAVAIALAVVVVGKTVVSADRLQDGAYVLDHQVNDIASALPTDAPVQLEGFGQGPLAPMEEGLVYERLNEQTAQQVSLYTATDESRGLLYLGGPRPIGVLFRPDYRYVVTRFAGIRTARQTIRRSGPIALERRAQPLDVLLTSGPRTGFAWQNPRGEAWVQPGVPVGFYVVGNAPNPSVHLTLDATGPVQVDGADSVKRRGRRLSVCLPTTGSAPVHLSGAVFSFTPFPPPPASKYAIPEPVRGLRLSAMTADPAPCAPVGRGPSRSAGR